MAKKKEKVLWLALHSHQYGTSTETFKASKEPSEKQLKSLFPDYEEDREEFIECFPLDTKDVVEFA